MNPILPPNFRLSCTNCTFPFFEDFPQQNTPNRQDVTTCLDQTELQFPFSKDHFLYKAIVPVNRGTGQIRLSYSVAANHTMSQSPDTRHLLLPGSIKYKVPTCTPKSPLLVSQPYAFTNPVWLYSVTTLLVLLRWPHQPRTRGWLHILIRLGQ